MTAIVNNVLHVPAHKQTDPAKKPGQVVNTPGFIAHGTSTGRFTHTGAYIEEVQPQNVWLSAVKQDKEQAK